MKKYIYLFSIILICSQGFGFNIILKKKNESDKINFYLEKPLQYSEVIDNNSSYKYQNSSCSLLSKTVNLNLNILHGSYMDLLDKYDKDAFEYNEMDCLSISYNNDQTTCRVCWGELSTDNTCKECEISKDKWFHIVKNKDSSCKLHFNNDDYTNETAVIDC